MPRALYYNASSDILTEISPDNYTHALQDNAGVLWADFTGEEPKPAEEILLSTFGFHPLAVDDALQETHVPKVDDWEKYLYIAMHAISYKSSSEDIDTIELDIFLGENYIVTHHDLPIQALERVWDICHKDVRYFKRGADHVLYEITDGLIVDYMQVVEALDEEIERVEDIIFDNSSAKIVQRIFTLKRTTLHLRRVLSPLREVLNKLARDDYAVIDARDRVYFRDVYDHLVRLHDISESLRDLVGGVLDTYLSVINNRMNDIMKTLTMITTIFMPISFLVGFYGMNFFQPTSGHLMRWTGTAAFIVMMAVMIGTPILMFTWMRQRRWM
ncbi:MAG: magnesium and cobalt transport protein CorA [Anaerolineales bacterium]|nr:magnesium/cobalt transporter CorA [Anaerolineae bacterium]PWB56644.1 MAG: magnesium and cobalt transport protein CorA [Anaerolineales bacterium]